MEEKEKEKNEEEEKRRMNTRRTMKKITKTATILKTIKRSRK